MMVNYMKIVGFAFYYLNLRIKSFFGIYRPSYPLGIKWRWKHWLRSRNNTLARRQGIAPTKSS